MREQGEDWGGIRLCVMALDHGEVKGRRGSGKAAIESHACRALGSGGHWRARGLEAEPHQLRYAERNVSWRMRYDSENWNITPLMAQQ